MTEKTEEEWEEEGSRLANEMLEAEQEWWQKHWEAEEEANYLNRSQ